MTFESQETSKFSGAPVDLYLIRYGSDPDAFYAYTDAETPVIFEGVTYRPVPIRREAIKATGTLDKSSLNVRTSANLAFAQLFQIYPPTQVISLTIRQMHLTDLDGEAFIIWAGRVLSASRQDSETTYTCEPISTSLKRTGLRRNYQFSCPHVLYGPDCRADKIAATNTQSIVNTTTTKVTLVNGWAEPYAPADYIGGIVEWQGVNGKEYRTILRVNSGVELSLSGPTLTLDTGDEIDVVLGCPHTLAGCSALHDNIVNYGGQPFIPLNNPVNKNPFN